MLHLLDCTQVLPKYRHCYVLDVTPGADTATRVRLAFAAAHPEAALFRSLIRSFSPQAP